MIIDVYPEEEFLQADGFDDAIIGVADGKLVYSISKSIAILAKEMTKEEAVEYFEFNVSGAYVGEKTPIWVDDNFLF
jgi:hypothetical protein